MGVGRLEKVRASHGTPPIAAALQFPHHHLSVVRVIPGAWSAVQARADLEVSETPVPEAIRSDLKSEDLFREDAPWPERGSHTKAGRP